MASAVGFRISSWDTPLRVASHRSPGRYNRNGSPATQYIGLHPLVPWAEYLRFNDLRKREDLAELRLTVWALRVDLADAAEVSFEDCQTRFGIEPADLVSDDHSRCQALADRLRSDAAEPKQLIVPSAALPGARNLLILGERVPIPYDWTPVDSGDIPASAITHASGPPPELLERVRFRGEAHAELTSWEEGRAYGGLDL